MFNSLQGKRGIWLKLTFVLAVCGITITFESRAAEDSARFMAVTNWHATFTRTLHSSGSYTQADPQADPSTSITYAWSFNHGGFMTTEFTPFLPSPFQTTWTDLLITPTRTLSYTITDSVTETSDTGSFVAEAHGGPSMRADQGGAFFTIDATDDT